MNIEKSSSVYFNVRVEREIDGKESYDTISTEREDLARVVAKALKAEGFTVSLTRFIHRKTDRIVWKHLKV